MAGTVEFAKLRLLRLRQQSLCTIWLGRSTSASCVFTCKSSASSRTTTCGCGELQVSLCRVPSPPSASAPPSPVAPSCKFGGLCFELAAFGAASTWIGRGPFVRAAEL
eukprot:3232947-Amphidinium_carterae.1